jgi:glycosyltransferase involved in cell wall biosynthesis
MRPLRVAYLPASLRAAGAERQMLTLAERLPRDRFEVEFVLIGEPGEYAERARAGGIPVRSLGKTPAPGAGRLERLSQRASKVRRYLRIVRTRHYDIVDAWLYPADVLAAVTRPMTGVPVVISGRRNVDPHGQFGGIEAAVGALAGRLTDAVVANSAAVAEHAVERQGVNPAKVRIIRNGVERAVQVSTEERASRRAAMGIADDAVALGAVANYRDVKRLDLLVDAVSLLAREGLPVHLELIGEGPLRPELERQVRELGLERLVCLHGSVLDPESVYPALDIVVQSSVREGLPNALLEAAAAGCAIVATAAGGSAEIVLDGQTGLLVPINDPQALTTAIRRMLTEPELRRRLGAAARAHVERVFGMDRFVAEFADLYESLAEARRVRR